MECIIGIDLGTTNSCVAVAEHGSPVVIPNRSGYRTTPSVVAVTDAGKRIVGHVAKRQAISNAENTVTAAKRLIGRSFSSPQVRAAVLTSSYRIVEGPGGDARIALRDGVHSVPEISATVLQEMKAIAEDYLGQRVSKAVVTVPAYFNDNQRQATKDAGTIAGLDVIRIINEPTAAALAYGFGASTDKTVAVFDLGGGTLDISILEITSNGIFKVVATAGDSFLGGEDFDARIIDWLASGFQSDYGIDLTRDRTSLQRLRDAAEKAKCELSTASETEINLPFVASRDEHEALHLQRVLTREILETLCADLIDRAISICEQTLADADLEPSEIEDVILVGGMTRMPRVQRAVSQLFGREANRGVHPDEVVAVGAAIQGAALAGEGEKMILIDVTPHALGILTVGNQFDEIISRNTSIPSGSKKVFTTSRDNQPAVEIIVVQGRSETADQWDVLGEFTLPGLRRAPRGEVEIEVSFDIDADGIVAVSAKDVETGREQSIQVRVKTGMNRQEVMRMAEEARHSLAARRVDEEFENARHEAERLIAEIERLEPAVEERLGASEFGRDAMARAKATIQKAKDAIESQDAAGVSQYLESLARTKRMYRGVVASTQ